MLSIVFQAMTFFLNPNVNCRRFWGTFLPGLAFGSLKGFLTLGMTVIWLKQALEMTA